MLLLRFLYHFYSSDMFKGKIFQKIYGFTTPFSCPDIFYGKTATVQDQKPLGTWLSFINGAHTKFCLKFLALYAPKSILSYESPQKRSPELNFKFFIKSSLVIFTKCKFKRNIRNSTTHNHLKIATN